MAGIVAAWYCYLINPALPERLMAGRTSFVIAHRVSTIRHCDQIIQIEDGGLVDERSGERVRVRMPQATALGAG